MCIRDSRILRKSLALFFICGEVIQWSAMFLYLLYTVVTGQEDMPSAVFDLSLIHISGSLS